MTATTAARTFSRDPEAARDEFRELVRARFEASIAASDAFFPAQADQISRACLAMARRFARGGRLLVFGEGAQATDAQHVAVEFVHPVIVGKRALPAIALPGDVAILSPTPDGAPSLGAFARAIDVLGRADDIAMGLSHDGLYGVVGMALERARDRGMLTLALCGGRAHALPGVHFQFAVPARDPFVVQEVQETLYHVLWELVHVCFEHRLDVESAEERA